MRLRDRVRDTSITTGTGTITLSGTPPSSNLVSFGSQYATGDSFCYAIVQQSSGEWETGLGTLLTATTFTRDEVFESSNSDALVNFSAGTKDVFVTASGALIEEIQNWFTLTGRNYV